MEELLKILQSVKPGVDFAHETDLIGDHILDSLSIVMLIPQLCDEFDIEITPPDIVPENFRSAETIYALIKRLEDED